MSFILTDGTEKNVEAGIYALEIEGSAVLSWDLIGQNIFKDITDATAGQHLITLPPCTVKCTGAGAITFALASK